MVKKRLKDFESWIDENRPHLNDIINQIFKSFDLCTMPKHLGLFTDFEDGFLEELLRYIHEHSTASLW